MKSYFDINGETFELIGDRDMSRRGEDGVGWRREGATDLPYITYRFAGQVYTIPENLVTIYEMGERELPEGSIVRANAYLWERVDGDWLTPVATDASDRSSWEWIADAPDFMVIRVGRDDWKVASIDQ